MIEFILLVEIKANLRHLLEILVLNKHLELHNFTKTLKKL